ncbi:MAG: acyclic terpene utilization AtuA family protein [Ignavibacteria bacterium]
MKEKIRIASGQGFWGDLVDAPYKQAIGGPVDYIMMDYLAEVTMSILQKQKLKDPSLGYARDIPPLMQRLLPVIKEKNIKVITNGGGVNPFACKDAIFKEARKLGIKELKIGVVYGDNILDRIGEFTSLDVSLNNMETGESVSTVADKMLSANVYFGAQAIVDCLKQGADIVVTGRVTDTGLTLAPMIYEFGWDMNDWDLMVAGTVAGHIIECGGQASGGNFLGDWKSIPDLARIGFPIAEAYPNGEVIITKHENTGGKVSIETVSQQLVYEIGDPMDYITPDCIADFTSIKLEDVGENRVRMYDVKGFPATEYYKVSMSYSDGYSAFGSLTYSWPDALEKAKAADEILRIRLNDLGLKFEEIRTEFQGYNACHGPIAKKIDDLNEVVLRVGVRSFDRKAVERFGMEIAPLILTGPPGVTGFAGGRPKPSDVVAYWPALIKKDLVKPEFVVENLK